MAGEMRHARPTTRIACRPGDETVSVWASGKIAKVLRLASPWDWMSVLHGRDFDPRERRHSVTQRLEILGVRRIDIEVAEVPGCDDHERVDRRCTWHERQSVAGKARKVVVNGD